MYNYKEKVKSDVREWMEDNRDLWEGLDRHDTFDAVYDSCWVADEVTGNASGSYTFFRCEARRNIFEDSDSDEYISDMIKDGFITAEDLGNMIAISDWEKLDVTIRCWLLCDAVTAVLDEVFVED